MWRRLCLGFRRNVQIIRYVCIDCGCFLQQCALRCVLSKMPAATSNSGTRNELACAANCLHCTVLLTCTNDEATRITAHTGCRMYNRGFSDTAFARINASYSEAGMNVPPLRCFAYFCAYVDCWSPTAGHGADNSLGQVGVGSRGSGSRKRKAMVRLEVRHESRKVP